MNTAPINSLLAVCEILDKYSVQYLIVGGAAVALHGYFRHSMNTAGKTVDKHDLDVWYNPTYDNYYKLLNAMENLGRDVTAFRQEQAPNSKESFFKFEFDDFTLDLLPILKSPLQFRSCFERREVVRRNGIAISFISFDDLIRDKGVNPRPKDVKDIEQLKNLRKKDE